MTSSSHPDCARWSETVVAGNSTLVSPAMRVDSVDLAAVALAIEFDNHPAYARGGECVEDGGFISLVELRPNLPIALVVAQCGIWVVHDVFLSWFVNARR